MDLAKYQRFKTEIEEVRRAQDRAQGAKAQVLKRLKDEHDCPSLDEAETKYQLLVKQQAVSEAEFVAELEAFETEWKEKLVTHD